MRCAITPSSCECLTGYPTAGLLAGVTHPQKIRDRRAGSCRPVRICCSFQGFVGDIEGGVLIIGLIASAIIIAHGRGPFSEPITRKPRLAFEYPTPVFENVDNKR